MPVFITRVQVEHRLDSLGVGEPRPRLSWRFEGDSQNWAQVAYEIIIRRAGGEEVHRVDSSESVLVPWPSSPLGSRERAEVVVTSFGSDGTSCSSSLVLEAALISRSDWVAKPITCESQAPDQPKRPFRLRRSFNLPSAFTTARLYITALGVYEAEINGKPVSGDVLSPGWTEYRFHLNYSTFDITDAVVPGENVIGAWVAEGWYAGRLGFRGGRRNIYGDRCGLIAQLEVDGVVVAVTDETWEWAYGAFVASELYDGETFDSRLEHTLTSPSADTWRSVDTLPFPSATLISSQSPPARQVATIRPQSIITTPSGATVVDFGQNFAGVVEFLSDPPAGATEIVLRHAEVLEHGELGTRPLRACKATDRIILGGQSIKGYRPKFTFHGFRYAEVTGWPGLEFDDLAGVVIQTAMERTGHFSCSHQLLNRLHENVVWSWVGNTLSLPTDCPQRDERLGWTGDVQVFTPTASFLFDVSGFLAGWLRDLHREQEDLGGVVPVVVPDILERGGTEVANRAYAIWGDTAVLTPHDLYTAFGDVGVLEAQWESMVLWLEKGVVRDPETRRWSKNHPQLGDWLAPKADPRFPGLGPTDNHLVADVYLIHTTRVAAEVAGLLGRQEQRAAYEKEVDAMLASFYHEYVTPGGRILSDTQTALALILHFDIFPSSHTHLRTVLRDRLAELVTRDLWQVNTGFAGTPIILHSLANSHLLHHAYRMLQSRDSPSWLACVLLGATTTWERWDSMLADGTINKGSMTSFNHYALGSVASFLHAVVGGLSPLEPGWKRVLVKPQSGGTVTQASVTYLSPYGRVACSWETRGGMFEMEMEVPPNCTARVVLPGKEGYEEVGSGRRSFSCRFSEDARFPPPVVQPPFTARLPNNWVP
ncbi:hypothetical protein IAT38_005893 [Cryptococcus sp. DSM 104549]